MSGTTQPSSSLTAADLQQALKEAVKESQSLHIHDNAIFYAERLFDLQSDYANLFILADAHIHNHDRPTALRLLQAHYPFFEPHVSRPSSAGPMPPSSATAWASGSSIPLASRSSLRRGDDGQPILSRQPVDLEARWMCQYVFGICCYHTQRFGEGSKVLTELLRITARINADHHTTSAVKEVDGCGAFFISAERMAGVRVWLAKCDAAQHLDSPPQLLRDALRDYPLLFTALEELAKCGGDVDGASLQYYAASSPRASTQAAARGGRPPIASASATPPRGGVHHRDAMEEGSFTPPPSRSSAVVVDSPPRPPITNFNNSSSTWRSPSGCLSSAVERRGLLLRHLHPYARIIHLLHNYRCAEALKLMQQLPLLGQAGIDHHTQSSSTFMLMGGAGRGCATGWLHLHQALAHFHRGDVSASAAAFAAFLEVAPWQLNEEAIIFYSTALWQLKAESVLGALSQRLVEEMPLSPITLCVVANTYSLVKEPKEAVVMLQRAVQIAPHLAYAHTLRGYEHLSMDEKKEAEEAFREAIKMDRRLYIAYAGLGELYGRQECIEGARRFFQHAMALNPLPAVVNHYAAVLHGRGASHEELEEALRLYDFSLHHNPHNFTGRHQRADVLIRLGRLQAAHRELVEMMGSYPEEAMLYVTLARCLQAMGDTVQAMRHFHTAMNLDPRREVFIRGCLERLVAESHPSTA